VLPVLKLMIERNLLRSTLDQTDLICEMSLSETAHRRALVVSRGTYSSSGRCSAVGLWAIEL